MQKATTFAELEKILVERYKKKNTDGIIENNWLL
jgi:hypothetical protein